MIDAAEIAELFYRDLTRLLQEVDSFPDDAAPWRVLPGIANAAGNLVLHLEGNLRAYIGQELGGIPFERRRELEFSTTGLGVAALRAKVQDLRETIPAVIAALSDELLAAIQREEISGKRVSTRQFLMHLYGHLSYHLGQIDSLRRIGANGPPLAFVDLVQANWPVSGRNVPSSQHRIGTPPGSLFARRWTPPAPHHRPNLPAILLFHDSLGCVALWRDFPAHLACATVRTVVAYDRLGFGRSDPHPGSLSPAFIREEALESVPKLCQAFGLERIVPFGHSVGGAMAIASAAQWPSLCPAVVAESAQTFPEDVTLAGIRQAQVNFARPGQFERLARYHGDKARWVLDNWVETWLSPSFAGWSLDDDLRRVLCPLLAIHGDRDEYGSPKHPEQIRRLAPGESRIVLLEDCGHVPHREHEARVLSEVARFLAR